MYGKNSVTCCIIYIEDILHNKSQIIAIEYFVIIKIERQRIYEQYTIPKRLRQTG